jgi:predicted PurR-regulated permease PerM
MPQDSDDTSRQQWDGPARPIARRRRVATLPLFATIVAVCAILALAQGLFLPLVLAMLFTFILTPPVNALRRSGLPDSVAVVLTVAAAASLLAAFTIFLFLQFGQIGAQLPLYQRNVIDKIDSLLALGTDSPMIDRLQQMLETIESRLEPEPEPQQSDEEIPQVEVVERVGFGDWLVNVILPALAPLAMFGLISVIVFFALLERDILRDRLVQLIGGSNIVATSRLLREAGRRVSGYLLAQVMLNAIYAVPVGIGLWLIGVPNALFFGLVTMVLRFIPYFGTWISALLPLMMAFAVSPGWSLVLWTLALFLLIEAVTSNVIEPMVYGSRTGITPLAVILSAFFWTWLWGPMGLIIATPLTVCLVVIGEHVPKMRLFPIMLGDKAALAGSAQLYDRLLTGNPVAFTDAAAADQDLPAFYDRTAIPALARAQADLQAGLLSEEDAGRIAEAAWRLSEEIGPQFDQGRTGTGDPDADEPVPAIPARADGRMPVVAVVGARTSLDDVAAAMLAQVMRAAGASALALPHWTNLYKAVGPLEAETVVLVSLDPPPGPSLVHKLRSLRRLFPAIRLGIALWPDPDDRDGDGDGPEAAPEGAPQRSGDGFEAVGIPAILAATFPPDDGPGDQARAAR